MQTACVPSRSAASPSAAAAIGLSRLDCPHCGESIALDQALATQVRAEVESSVADERRRQLAEAVASAQKQAREQVQQETRAAVAESAQRLREAQARLAAQDARLAQAEDAEMVLRRRAAELEQRARSQALEVEREVQRRQAEWQTSVRRTLEDEQALRMREKEQQIGEMRRVIEDLRRRSESTSPQRHGEVLELSLEEALAARFPHDRIRPVPKGAAGADIVQEVRDAALAPCGSIVWEIKHTRTWQASWLPKLRDDQRACGASVAVLVSATLPEAAVASGFARIDGVWVCGLGLWSALANVLREQIVNVAQARRAASGMDDRMKAIHGYLAGDAFRHRVEAIVESFVALQDSLSRQRRGLEKVWKEQERQLERALSSTSGMWGELGAMLGAAVAPIPALELESFHGGTGDAERPAVGLRPQSQTAATPTDRAA